MNDTLFGSALYNRYCLLQRGGSSTLRSIGIGKMASSCLLHDRQKYDWKRPPPFDDPVKA